jgi:hypothetical protein
MNSRTFGILTVKIEGERVFEGADAIGWARIALIEDNALMVISGSRDDQNAIFEYALPKIRH